MITRFTLGLKKEAVKEWTLDEDIFTDESFNARPPTPTSIMTIRSDILQTWRPHEHA